MNIVEGEGKEVHRFMKKNATIDYTTQQVRHPSPESYRD